MKVYGNKTLWLVTGSQTLYGPEVLAQVERNSREIAAGLDASAQLSAKVVFKDVVKSPEEILKVCLEANNDPDCAGLVLWMHTFSPAKMWIAGLAALRKPWLHLHTQFSAELPWDTIDMNYMNLNQSAHGDREFGHVPTRMGKERKVVVGHWKAERVQRQIDDWARAAMGWNEAQTLSVARFGDNMRQVAVTEGDKVSAQMQFGYNVQAYGLGDLAEACDAVSDADIDARVEAYHEEYTVDGALMKDDHTRECIRNEARLEIGMERFLGEKGCMAFTNNFENLTGLTGLPGLATQRLMSRGWGYGGEGDWKTAAMTRIAKVMAEGREQGTSFMEDYTYHFGARDQVLGSHMLEICPSIAAQKPTLEVHLHTIGIRKDIARLRFNGTPGPSMMITVIDLGHRYRMLVNELDTVEPPRDLPKLPTARALWEPRPDLEVSATCWIHAGGGHHSVYTQALSLDAVRDYADLVDVELAVIGADTTVPAFRDQLRHGAAYWSLRKGVL